MSLNKGLGKGLGALFSDAPAGRPGNSGTEEAPRTLPLADIKPNAEQPRKNFNDESLQELAESIRRQGILQPLLVRPMGNGYQLVAGERRWRAAKLAGLGKVPVVIRVMDDRDVMVAALIENLQREDLNPVEEGAGPWPNFRRRWTSRKMRWQAASAKAARPLPMPCVFCA